MTQVLMIFCYINYRTDCVYENKPVETWLYSCHVSDLEVECAIAGGGAIV